MNDNKKNGVKNGEATQFSTTNQPSNDAKKAGWARKKRAQAFMDLVAQYLDLTVIEFQQLGKTLKGQKNGTTVQELLAYQYTSRLLISDKLLLDWLDRHIGKAPSNFLSEPEKKVRDKISVEIVYPENYTPT